MSTTSQVISNFYVYLQQYVQNNGGTLVWSPPCGPKNFTYDFTQTTITFHTWNYSFAQPTLTDLQAITPETISASVSGSFSKYLSKNFVLRGFPST